MSDQKLIKDFRGNLNLSLTVNVNSRSSLSLEYNVAKHFVFFSS